MTLQNQIDQILGTAQSDSGQWTDIPGRWCLKKFREVGPVAVQPIHDLFVRTSDNCVKFHCAYLLICGCMPEADEAITNVLDLPMDDEVLEFIFEEAVGWDRMRANTRFVEKARELSKRRDNPALTDFFSRVDESAM